MPIQLKIIYNQKLGILCIKWELTEPGICGLNTAMTLHRNQIEFKIFESSNKPGGCIKSLYEFDSIIKAAPIQLMVKIKIFMISLITYQ